MNSLIHVVYASVATATFSEPALRELLERARSNNAALDVTGILLLVDNSFFQVLEGAAGPVTDLYQRISRDKRHRQVVKLIQEPIAKRDFQEWSMGLARVASHQLAKQPGFSDFFASKRTLDALDEGLTRRLLGQFRDGHWRAHVGD